MGRRTGQGAPADPPHWRLAFVLLAMVRDREWTPFLRLLILLVLVAALVAVLSAASSWPLLAAGGGALALLRRRKS